MGSAPKPTMPAAAGEADDPLAGLLAAVSQGDRAAFSKIYKMSSTRLLGVAVKMLRNKELAEEVLQESFLVVWQKAGQFNAEHGRAMAWLTTIVRHRAIDRIRKSGASPEIAVGSDAELDLLAAPAASSGELEFVVEQAILKCLELIKQKQKELIQLAFYYGFTHDELAQRLGMPLGTVKSDVRRGLADLKVCLER